MNRPFPGATILRFGMRFCLLLAVLLPLWWWAIPLYGWTLAQGCRALLNYAAGVPVEAARIESGGLLNTGSQLVFLTGGRERAMELARLATNMPVLWALLLATPGHGGWRRAGALAAGSGILAAAHAAFIVFAISISPSPPGALPAALAQFGMALPFLIWALLASGATMAESARRLRFPGFLG